MPDEAAQEAERQACEAATFNSEPGRDAERVDDEERQIEREIDRMLAGQQQMAIAVRSIAFRCACAAC